MQFLDIYLTGYTLALCIESRSGLVSSFMGPLSRPLLRDRKTPHDTEKEPSRNRGLVRIACSV